MSNTCYIQSCKKSPKLYCECSEPPCYICKIHSSIHISTPGTHNCKSLLLPLSSSDGQKLFHNLLDLNNFLSSLKLKALSTSKNLCNTIDHLCKSYIFELTSLKSILRNLMLSITNKSTVNTLHLRISQSVHANKSLFSDMEKLHRAISHLYNPSHLFTSQSAVMTPESSDFNTLIYSDTSHKLYTIDLKDLTKRMSLSFDWIGYSLRICRVNSSFFFINGGFPDENQGRSSYLFNVQDGRKISLSESKECVYASGGVKVERKIYFFGGAVGRLPINRSECYDLASDQWSYVANIPTPSFGVMGSVMEKGIMLTGYHLDKVYVYSDNSYYQVLNVTAREHKILCQQWMLTSEFLYENDKKHSMIWNKYCIVPPWDLGWLWNYYCFNRDRYIYFITTNNKLTRIDTLLKRVESIEYKDLCT